MYDKNLFAEARRSRAAQGLIDFQNANTREALRAAKEKDKKEEAAKKKKGKLDEARRFGSAGPVQDKMAKGLHKPMLSAAKSHFQSIVGDHVWDGQGYDDRLSHAQNKDKAQAKGMMVPGRDHVVHAHADPVADHLAKKFGHHPGFSYNLAHKIAVDAGHHFFPGETEESDKYQKYKDLDAKRARERANKPKKIRIKKSPEAAHNKAGFKTKTSKPPFRGTGSYGSASYAIKEEIDFTAAHKHLISGGFSKPSIKRGENKTIYTYSKGTKLVELHRLHSAGKGDAGSTHARIQHAPSQAFLSAHTHKGFVKNLNENYSGKPSWKNAQAVANKVLADRKAKEEEKKKAEQEYYDELTAHASGSWNKNIRHMREGYFDESYTSDERQIIRNLSYKDPKDPAWKKHPPKIRKAAQAEIEARKSMPVTYGGKKIFEVSVLASRRNKKLQDQSARRKASWDKFKPKQPEKKD